MSFLAYPVSFVMKFWHWVLGLVVDPNSGLAWAGSVLLLVVTVRLLLMRSMWRQQYSMRKMAQLTPQMKAIQKKYKGANDPQAQAKEMQELYAGAGVHPAAGCIPLLVQIPVFIGLYHVLINFSPRGMSLDDAARQSNGAFNPEQVSSFLHAEIFGVPLSAYIRMPQDVIDSLHPGLQHSDIVWFAVPLFALAGIATFVNMWNSFRRQSAAKKAEKEAAERADAEERAGGPVVDGEVVEIDGEAVPERKDTDVERSAAAKPQDLQSMSEQMQESVNQSMKMMMYLFPFFPLVGAFFLNFPVAIGLYWLTNNIWTAVQSHLFMERLEKELPMTSKEGLPPSAFM